MKKNAFASVILDTVSDALDRSFQYSIPYHLQKYIKIGSGVLVPFRNTKIKAYVVALDEEPLVDAPKEILDILHSEPFLTPEMVELSYWVSRFFFNRWIEAIRLCLPPAVNKVKTACEENVLPAVDKEVLLETSIKLKNKALRQALILEYLAMACGEGISWKKLKEKTGAERKSLQALIQKGLVKISKVPLARNPFRDKNGLSSRQPLIFSEEQEKGWEKLKNFLSGAFKQFLIYGITGSGKTELYLRAAEEVLKQNRTALFLVPEIALTPQIIEQFRGRFSEEVALLHSSLSAGERYHQWWRVRRGEARIVLGARSAVFAPLENIGVIVMDEEHENTYKQEDSPRYHARDVARWRASYHQALLLLGSATPSLETFLEAQKGNIEVIELTRRIAGRPLPAVEVVDMRHEFRRKNKSIFSTKLLNAMEETLSRGEQLMLFLNRRGFASFQLCRYCGFVARCPYCSVSLTYHSLPEHLQCHFCGFKRTTLSICPACKSRAVYNFGVGTQKVELEVKKIFPGIEVIRMDSDAIGGKGAYERIWRIFKEGHASVLIGTQMIAKGLDFPEVTLVGVIAADINLHLPDFRAGERTFQLISQVAGRAGRGNKRGKVIVQTFTPHHYSIRSASTFNYSEFIQEEFTRRKILAYPPFGEMIIFSCSSRKENEARETLELLKTKLEESLLALKRNDKLLGPSPAPLKKIKDYYRYHLIYKGKDLQQNNEAIRKVVWNLRNKLRQDIRLTVDFNPFMML